MTITGLLLEIHDGVAQLTFTQVARGNPIDGPLCASLSETAIEISENRDIRCVLMSAGRQGLQLRRRRRRLLG
jgi:enoyl-CoA hydratase/carnithine racemase